MLSIGKSPTRCGQCGKIHRFSRREMGVLKSCSNCGELLRVRDPNVPISLTKAKPKRSILMAIVNLFLIYSAIRNPAGFAVLIFVLLLLSFVLLSIFGFVLSSFFEFWF